MDSTTFFTAALSDKPEVQHRQTLREHEDNASRRASLKRVGLARAQGWGGGGSGPYVFVFGSAAPCSLLWAILHRFG